MSKDEYLITDAPLKALTVFAMPMILGSFFQQVPFHLFLIFLYCTVNSPYNSDDSDGENQPVEPMVILTQYFQLKAD